MQTLQFVGAVAFSVALAVPASQGVGVAAPAPHQYPAGHAQHVDGDVALLVLLKVPGSQKVGEAEPLAHHAPAGHGVGEVAPVAQNAPAGHVTQVDAVAAELTGLYDPEAQRVGELAPLEHQAPGGHGPHVEGEVAPTTPLKVPAAQLVQVAALVAFPQEPEAHGLHNESPLAKPSMGFPALELQAAQVATAMPGGQIH